MDAFIVTWLKGTALSHLVLTTPWLWPACEMLHFVGIALVIGIAGLFDLRLMGYMTHVPVAAVMQLRPWAGAGVLINLVTGVIFFVATPEQYIRNVSWWAKVFFLLVATANIVFFETRYGRTLLTMPAGIDTPRSFKIAGVVSIVSWLAVLYFGRMLPFLGNAF
jgi:hypothetical protein